ncbi:MAG: 5-(carboxyamino)imidazole ribonucleotide mutase [Tissierellia bacterium]|nr:5-(carboxyamino)imidazole ribonucleotide mutase [Tissierellia bacterium]
MEIAIIMGSISDREVADDVAKVLKDFGVGYSMHVISAHRSPEKLAQLLDQEEDLGTKVYIAMAGKAAHLAGVIAGKTVKPVIGLPIKSSLMGGLDSLLSTVQMPSGVPVATVAVNGGKNAGLLALQILALSDEDLNKKLRNYKLDMAQDVEAMDAKLKED